MSTMEFSGRLPSSILRICRTYIRSPTASIISNRPFSSTTSTRAVGDLTKLSKTMTRNESPFASSKTSTFDQIQNETRYGQPPATPYHLHVFASKHNTIITLTHPNREPIVTRSAGSLGFKNSARGTYDAAYQLCAYVLGFIYDGGWLNKIDRLEVIMRGFGVGREAVTKALLGPEGKQLKPRIVQVSDCTRLKFGGTRSKKPRRLG